VSDNKSNSRPPRRKGSHWYKPARIVPVLLLLFIAAAVGAYFAPTDRWVRSGGYVVTDDEAELRPSEEGAIASWHVRSGDRVEKGDLLIQLNDTVQRASYEESQSRLSREQAEMDRLQSQQELSQKSRAQRIRQAERDLALQKLMAERITTTAGAFSQKEVEEAKLKVELAESKLADAMLDPAELMDRQIKVLRQDIATSEKNLARLEAELELRKIRAPLAGEVYFHSFETGEVVKTQDVLGQVFDPAKWIVKLKLNERDMPFVELGQPVKVGLSAYPWYRFGYARGEVSRIYPVISQQTTGDGIVYVEAVITDFGELEPRPGLTADTWINTGETNWLFRVLGVR